MEKVLEKANYGTIPEWDLFGNGSYGIASALNYFNKSLSSLDLQEMAMLAAYQKLLHIQSL